MPTTVYDTENAPRNLVELLKGGGSGGGAMRITASDSDPKDGDGQPGDVHINGESGDLFQKASGTWEKTGNLEGPAGNDGSDGDAATVKAGSTSTGNAGTDASVKNSGSNSAAVFDFTIPQGKDGKDGADGNNGNDGADGTTMTAAKFSSDGTTLTLSFKNADDIVADVPGTITNG